MYSGGQFTNRKHIFAFLCLLTIFLSACDLFGGNNDHQLTRLVKAAAKYQVYIDPQIGISDLSTLDPAQVNDTSSANAIQMVFTGLVQLDDKLQVRPQLAQSWDESSNGLTWTFHLKTNLKFSDGKPLTSRDVAYSIDRALQPATKSDVAPIYLGLIKDSEKLLTNRISTLIGDSLLAPNDTTLVVTIKRKAAYFLDMLAYPTSYVVEKSLVKKYGSTFPDHLTEGGGSGPWKVQRYLHGKEIDFVPNPNYYGPRPQLIKVIFPFYQQPGAVYRAYRAGHVDTASVPISTFASDRKNPDFHQVPQLWINYYTMNYLVKPFDNINIRRAFALAIDKTTIVNTVWKGTVLPTNHIVPQGMTAYNPHLTGPDGTQNLKGNPTEAKALLRKGLQEEKWSSVAQFPPIKLTYATGVSNFDAEVAALMRMWQSVLGVAVTADPVSFNNLLARITSATGNANGLQFWGFSWVAEYPDPQDWLTFQFDSGVPNNNMNYGQNASTDAAKQRSVQQLLEAADANSNQSARLQAYQQAEQQLVDDVAWLPMEQVTQITLRQPYVVGVVDNALGVTPPGDWANIYIAQH
jgi:oligopeptide transport system substrate-binding protein